MRPQLFSPATAAVVFFLMSVVFSMTTDSSVLAPVAFAAVGGTISGVVKDRSDAVVSDAQLRLTEHDLHTTFTTHSDRQGLYSFPSVPVGAYELEIQAQGFAVQRKNGIHVDTDSSLRLDLILSPAGISESVTVSTDTGIQVERSATHLGEVVNGTQITSLPLNGRSYTNLLAIQPGVTPATTQLPSSVIMAGVTGAIPPSGDQNPGNVSINGQRESSNGFFVDGIDVQEHMNGGTSVLPNIDSLSEFRVLTNNFDPEYGNYNGGMITVVTRSGSNNFHGRAFDFFRNTALDSRGYFDPTKSVFRQHQFGGAMGGPLARTDIYFFGDYQGTRTTQGIPTGRITVLSSAERKGDFSSSSSTLNGCVSGPYLASLLSQRTGHAVKEGDPYSKRSTNCNSEGSPVFPGGLIPQRAWSASAQHLIQYIPSPNVDVNQFSSSSFNQTVRDDKGSWRLDRGTRVGQLSAYYFLDDYRLSNPYPGRQGGASIPGFDALSIGRAQLFALSLTSPMDAQTVSEFHIGYLRNANVIGEPNGGRGVSLASQGFTTGAGTPGILVQAPELEGVENIAFPTFTMGVPITNVDQVNNTLFVSESVAHAIGRHTLKAGVQFHADQVNEHPNATFNGTFNINGTETGSAFADFLIGTPSNFTQSSGQPFYLRNNYTGLFIQDSWRLRDDLTINAGLRWDFIAPWSEKYNQIQTVVPGQQSVVFPGAPKGFVFPGDPGIPSSLAPRKAANLSPRLGIAYVPNPKSSVLRDLFGDGGKTSIRASFGMFYTAFPGLATGIMYAVPPFGYNYLSPSPPIFETPFINAKDGVNNGQRFPFPFPAHGASASRPDNSIDWSNFVPISADPYFDHSNDVAYTENYMLSLQRQVGLSTLATVSYVGNQGHHILMLLPTNPGDPALCLSLPGCGPFGEDSAYVSASGDQVQGTRRGLGPDYGAMTAQRSIGNSNYNALEANVRYTSGEQQVSVGYTFSKSIDQGSNLGEQLNPIDQRRTRAISAFDLRQNLIVSYTAGLPFRRLFSTSHAWAIGWSLAGTMRASSGFPVTLYDNSDHSLMGTLGNGVNNYLLDTPNYAGGPLNANTNGRNRRAAFNTSQFSVEELGQLGNTPRRFFYGPGQINFDTALSKTTALRDGVLLDLRLETFNTFNHALFFGPAAVAGQIQDSNFGRIASASPPRLIQIAAKASF